MNKASLKLDRYGDGYEPYSDDTGALSILGIFLSTEVLSSLEYNTIYKWLKNPTDKSKSGGNLTDLKKIDNNVCVVLGFALEKYKDDPEEYSLIIPIEKLIKIMEDWNKTIKSWPKYIILTEKNNEYSVAASDKPHKPFRTLTDYENKLKTVMELIDNTYSIIVKKDDRFTILANFLIEDAIEQGSFEEWTKYAKDKIVSNNGTTLEKVNNNILLYLNSDPNSYLTIKIDQFIYILEKWHRLLLRKMPFVLIKEEEGRYGIIASSHNPTVPRIWGAEEDDDDNDLYKIDCDF